MRIWVDADACPQVIKEILFRAAERRQVEVTLVANRKLRTSHSRWTKSIQVLGGPDVADDHIAEVVEAGDLVITADIPLAARVVEKGGTGLNPRGELYDEENVRHRLSMRDFLHELRSDGVRTSGPPPLDQTQRQAFANQLDRFLTQQGH